ncbi:MAG: Glycosylphosphatidylinositol (GPI) anchor assembly protein [Trizodia sp. TS-e1964]|nr:MAG: Glycosylphosphatidylinositol (GPI) anchor assembly protein [Trizodia sp. TS-e1964]
MASTSTPTATRKYAPISLLNTQYTFILSNLHLGLLLSAYSACFSSLVRDPVPTLLATLAPLAIIQSSYAIACLPTTRHVENSQQSRAQKPGLKRKTEGRSEAGISRLVTALISAILALAVGTPLLTAMLILFGAPLTTHLPHTLAACAHIALLTLLPLVYVHGVDNAKWLAIAGLKFPLDELSGGLAGALFGCWMGAVPIPLDWDREWQKWPITIVTGAYLGYALGKLIGGFFLKGKAIKFE